HTRGWVRDHTAGEEGGGREQWGVTFPGLCDHGCPVTPNCRLRCLACPDSWQLLSSMVVEVTRFGAPRWDYIDHRQRTPGLLEPAQVVDREPDRDAGPVGIGRREIGQAVDRVRQRYVERATRPGTSRWPHVRRHRGTRCPASAGCGCHHLAQPQ